MSSKRRYDEYRVGPARYTRSRTANRRWSELDTNLLRLVASFLPLNTYAILCHRVLRAVSWGDERRRIATHNLEQFRGQFGRRFHAHDMADLSYLLINASEEEIDRLFQVLFPLDGNLYYRFHIPNRTIVTLLQRMPPAGRIAFSTRRSLLDVFDFVDYHLVYLISLSPIPYVFAKACLIQRNWLFSHAYHNPVSFLYSSCNERALRRLFDDTAELWPSVMHRWFGPHWKAVHKSRSISQLAEQVKNICETLRKGGQLYEWINNWLFEQSSVQNDQRNWNLSLFALDTLGIEPL